MTSLNGKTAIITGAAGGIGRATALLFARHGAKLVLGDVQDGVETTAQMVRDAGGQAHAVIGDSATEDGAEALVRMALDQFGQLDVVFANAGVSGPLLPNLDDGADTFAEILRINLTGTWLLVRASLPHMTKGGSIICTASVAGLRAGAGGIPYSASKAGVISLVQTTAMGLTGRGIRINAIAPGLIETPMTAVLYDQARAVGKEDKIGQLNPTRRGGEPDEIAQAVAFLASDAASYVNGQVLPVDGGLSAQHPFTPKWSL